MAEANSNGPYSVMLTVYEGDNPDEFDAAVRSCLEQSLPPEELLIVSDGPLTTELEDVITEHQSELPGIVRHHSLPTNRGRGAAARAGVSECRNEYVGIMSADDICVPDRFERQVDFLESHPEVDVVGGHFAEFSDDPDDVEFIREVPTEPDAVERMARFRSPMNEVTVMFRRDAVLSAGNYRSVDRMEDYDLWVRMLQNGCVLANIDAVLVKVRAGEEMFARRGGLEYAREEFRQQTALFKTGFIGIPRFLFNLGVRVPIRLMPNSVRGFVYRQFTRTKPSTETGNKGL